MPYSVINLERGTPTSRRVGTLTGAVALAQVGATVDPFFSSKETATIPYDVDASLIWQPLDTPWTSKEPGAITWDANSGSYLGVQTPAPWMVSGLNLDVVGRLREPLAVPITLRVLYGKNLGLGVSLDQVILVDIVIPAGEVFGKAVVPVVNPMGGSPGSDGMLGFVLFTNGSVITFPVILESVEVMMTTGTNLHTVNPYFDGVSGWTNVAPSTISGNQFKLGKNAPLKTYLTQVLPAGAVKAQFWAMRVYCRQTGGGVKIRVGLNGWKFPIYPGWNMFKGITQEDAPGIELQILKDEAGDGLTDTIIDFVYAWNAIYQGEVLVINPTDGTVIDTFLAGAPGQVVGPCQICWGDAPPLSGVYQAGDIIYNTNPVSGGPSGWICQKDGNPGYWTTLPESVA